MDRSVSLPVGSMYHLKRGKDHIVYAGMPSEEVYSLVQIKKDGYSGFSWNLYFPKRRSEITVDGVDLVVENVTPDEIRIRVIEGGRL